MTTDTLEVGPATRSRLNASEWRILVICFLTAMIDGFDTLILAFIAPLVGEAFGLSPVEIGKLFAINFVGAVIGGLGYMRGALLGGIVLGLSEILGAQSAWTFLRAAMRMSHDIDIGPTRAPLGIVDKPWNAADVLRLIAQVEENRQIVHAADFSGSGGA